MNDCQHRNYITILFFYIEIFLFTLYMFLDILSNHRLFISDIFKYLGIILCFIYTGHLFKKRQTSIIFLICAFIMLFADYFLLFGGTNTLYGIILFCIIQIIYFIHVSSPKHFGLYIIFTLLLSLSITLLLFKYMSIAHPYIFWSIQYILMLSTNIVLSLVRYFQHKTPHNLLFTIGLFFCFMCDINVGLLNLSDIHNFNGLRWLNILQTPILQTITTLSMWFYYLPAQILIIFSQKIPKS